jgi:hypothetical protein
MLPRADHGAESTELSRLAELLGPSADAGVQKQQSKRKTFDAILVLGLSLPLTLWLTAAWPPAIRFLVIMVWVLLFLVVPGASPFPLLRRSKETRPCAEQETIHALAAADDPRAIGLLIDAEADSAGERQLAIHAALTRLLPRATELTLARLTDLQYERLYTHLDALAKLARYTTKPTTFAAYPLGGTWERTTIVNEAFPELRDEYEAFLMAALRGLETLGTEDTQRHLEAIVANGSPSDQYARIQQAAWETLNTIHERLEAQQAGRTLLRPTAEPTDSLVRPARNLDDTAPESLLRPTDED